MAFKKKRKLKRKSRKSMKKMGGMSGPMPMKGMMMKPAQMKSMMGY